MAAPDPSSADDPQTVADAAVSAPLVAGADDPSAPATGTRTRGKGARAESAQEAPSDAPLEPEPDPEAMVVALLLPEGETWCTADGTPYRASGGQPVYVRRRHAAELGERGASEPERATDLEAATA